MRTSVNLLLAAGLAASAFATTAAAPAKQAAACPNPDGLPVIDLSKKGATWTEEYEFIGTPVTGLYSGPDFIVDTFGKKQDVQFTVAWGDGFSDYDVEITDVAADAVIGEGAEADTSQEIVTVKGLADCLHIEWGIFNFVGQPYQGITLTAEGA